MSVPEEFKQLNLYQVLNIESSASDSEIKRAYRRRALATHPDKAGDAVEFQKVAFAYSVLSNKTQKARYDKNGSVEDIDDDLEAAFSRFKDIEITEEMIKEDKKVYRESQEREDTLFWYNKHNGDFDKVFSHVLHTEHDDQERIKKHIEEAINSGELKLKSKYKKTTTKKMDKKRKTNATKEAREAEKVRKNMGLDIKSTDDLAALIKSKQGSRNNFLDSLAEKYT